MSPDQQQDLSDMCETIASVKGESFLAMTTAMHAMNMLALGARMSVEDLLDRRLTREEHDAFHKKFSLATTAVSNNFAVACGFSHADREEAYKWTVRLAERCNVKLLPPGEYHAQ